MTCDILLKICRMLKNLLRNMNSSTTCIRIQLSSQQKSQNAEKDSQADIIACPQRRIVIRYIHAVSIYR